MKNIIRAMKIYLSYKKNLYSIFNFILAVLLSCAGVFIIEKTTSKYYMMPILFLDFALVLILVSFLGNDIELSFNRRFIKTTVVFKEVTSLVPIIINNILGCIYILIISAIKYVRNTNINNFSDTIFVLFVTIGIISCIKILLINMQLFKAILVVLVFLALSAMSKYHFIFLGIVKNFDHNNYGCTILLGIIICILINLAAYIYSVLLN